ncbi:cytochrome c biogenesis protein ResB, partial [Candidatus Sumerlaeota bacterium]|nr:cytochrome c biogenesis protein ResB [Candidatus Sumerlaeota bacterium]
PNRIKVHNPLIRTLGGLKLGLTVLTMIAIASTIGEFLPYDNDFSIRVVFKTWWYRTLLATMGVNLILNTYMTYIEETYPQFLPLFRKNPDHYRALKINHKANFKDSAKKDDPKGLMQTLAAAFQAKGYRTFFDGQGFYGYRGLIARFGSTVTHLGLITIIIGSLAESFFKVQGTVTLLEGDTADYYVTDPKAQDKHHLDFSIKLRDFDFKKYPGTETAAVFKSTVMFIPQKGEPRHDYVRVNHDVTYDGWTFHQTSYHELGRKENFPRYLVKLAEKHADGMEEISQFETYLPPSGREVTPIPGHDDRFFSAESDSSGRGVIWTVASKDEILARGVKSLFGDLRIEMLRFYPDLALDADNRAYNKSDEIRNPAAFVEITSENTVAYRQWVFLRDSEMAASHGDNPHAGDSPIDFVITDVALDPMSTADSGAGLGVVGSPDPAAMKGGSKERSVQERALVTISLKSKEGGAALSESYKLRLGESVPLAGELDRGYSIPGNYRLDGFNSIPSYVSYLDISKNPGIPVVWLGAILASFGPFIAFFVSRRRVWAYVDPAKKQIWVGGESRYSREALEDEIGETVEAWSASDDVKLEPAIKIPRPGSRPALSQYL